MGVFADSFVVPLLNKVEETSFTIRTKVFSNAENIESTNQAF
jgi:hypothetical protein